MWIECEVWLPRLLRPTFWTACHFLSQRRERDFLKRLVTGDEIRTKTCIENALDLRPNRPSLDFARTNFFYPFDGKGVVHYELLSRGETVIDSAKYCKYQLDKLKDAVAGNRPRSPDLAPSDCYSLLKKFSPWQSVIPIRKRGKKALTR